MTQKPDVEELEQKVRALEEESARGESADRRRYSALVESSMDAILLTTPDGRILFCNQAARDMFQMTQQEMVEGGRAAVVDENDPRLSEALQKRAKLGKYRGELRYRRKDGTYFDGEVSSVIFEDAGGQKRTSMVIRDISERKRREVLLRESEEKYRLVFDNAPLGIFHFEAGGVVTACNRELAEIVGAPRNKIIGFDMLSGLVDKGQKAALKAALSGESGIFEGDYTSVIGGKQLKVRTVYTPIISADGACLGGIGITEDITRQHLLRQELRDTVTLLENVYASLDEAVYVVDPATRKIISCNAAAERMSGHSNEEMVGRNTEFLHVNRKTYREFGKRLFPALDTDGIFFTEFLMRKKNGAVFPTEHTVKEIRDDSGKRILVVSVVRDITEQKRAMEELKAHEKELRAKAVRLEELNTALKVLLDQRERDKKRLEETLSENINRLVIPHLRKIRKTGLSDLQGECMDILESNLLKIIRPHMETDSAKLMALTPSETRIAHLIKQGYRIKEIAASLNVSPRTIEFHRDGIRRKLGIKHRKINLKTYLSRIS